jgi:outer membrane protein assembly factor BamB
MKTSLLLRSTVLLAMSSGLAHAEAKPGEWAAFRGPQGDGVSPAPAPLKNWHDAKLSKLWKTDTNTGFSSFSIGGGKAFTIVTDEVDGNKGECILALDVKTGKKAWLAPISAMSKYDGGGDAGAKTNKGGDGPRSTPVLDGENVYAIDSNLVVVCVNAATGKEVWRRDVIKDNAGVQIKWQNAASPLIEGNVLMMCGGGEGQALLGLNKASGDIVWKGENDKMTHATPVIATIHGTKQAIFYTQKGLVSVTPADGKVLWRQEYKFNVSTAASPIVWEDIVYCSAGYGVGAGAFKISADWKLSPLWRTEGDEFANHWSTPVVKDGKLYGMFSFKKYGEGPVACVDIKTGEMLWKKEGFGPGQVILSGDTVIAISDAGEIVFIEAKPAGYKEIKRKKLVDGKVWSYPVLAHDHLFARSTTEGGCWSLR